MASEYANATDSTSVGELKLLGNFTVTDNDATWIASLMPLGALFGGMYLAKGMGRKDNSFVVYKVKQNLGKQVLRIPCPKFHSPSSEQLTMDRWGSCADLLKNRRLLGCCCQKN